MKLTKNGFWGPTLDTTVLETQALDVRHVVCVSPTDTHTPFQLQASLVTHNIKPSRHTVCIVVI